MAGRLARYTANYETLKSGMGEMGFSPYVESDIQGCIITTFLFPDDDKFDFNKFYTELSARGSH